MKGLVKAGEGLPAHSASSVVEWKEKALNVQWNHALVQLRHSLESLNVKKVT